MPAATLVMDDEIELHPRLAADESVRGCARGAPGSLGAGLEARRPMDRTAAENIAFHIADCSRERFLGDQFSSQGNSSNRSGSAVVVLVISCLSEVERSITWAVRRTLVRTKPGSNVYLRVHSCTSTFEPSRVRTFTYVCLQVPPWFEPPLSSNVPITWGARPHPIRRSNCC